MTTIEVIGIPDSELCREITELVREDGKLQGDLRQVRARLHNR